MRLTSYTEDHWYTRCVFEIDTQDDTLDVLTDDNRAAQEWKLYEEEKQGMFSSFSAVMSFLPSKSVVDAAAIREVASKLTHEHLSVGVQKSLHLQREWLTDDRIPQIEMILGSGFFGEPKFAENGKRYMSLFMALLHPFSRGEVHLSSSDPLAAPSINPNVFDNDVDLDLLVGGIKLARTIVSTEPLGSSVVKKEVSPGTTVHTDEEIKSFVRDQTTTVFHPVGTASMLAEEDGGVVDANLKVYGTANLRVVDASIIPIQLGAHTQASVYGIAEKGADIIKATFL
jgi:choline dehydrogenase-like flavoprotein